MDENEPARHTQRGKRARGAGDRFGNGLAVSQMREAICGIARSPTAVNLWLKSAEAFINDSKATNVDAVEKALRSLPGRAC